MARKPLSKTTRFEVFKRDQFACQYCGAKAPEVVLHCDHIRPVADGGDDSLMNLVTSCAACNLGKGARALDDRSKVERQRTQIEELGARREQLEMMLQWRDQAEQGRVDVVDEISDRIASRGGFPPNEGGKANLRTWLKRFTASELLTAMDDAFDAYMKFRGSEPDVDAWEAAFAKIPVMANLNRQGAEKPYMPRLAYIQGILRKRLDRPRLNCIEAIESFHVDDGLTLDQLEQLAKSADGWEGFCVAAWAKVRGAQ